MKNKKLLYILIPVLIIFAAVSVFFFAKGELYAGEVTLDEMQTLINEAVTDISQTPNTPASIGQMCSYIQINAETIEYGSNKNILVKCTYSAPDVLKIWEDNKDGFLQIPTTDTNNRPRLALKISRDASDIITNTLTNNSDNYIKSGEMTVEVFETRDGLILWRSRDFMNTVFSGAYDVDIKNSSSETIQTPLKNGIEKALRPDYQKKAPDVSNALMRAWNSTKDTFRLNFIDDARWQYIAKGLLITLRITAIAVVIGIVLGFIVAIIRTTHDKTGKLKALNWVCKLYLTIIRGTPVIVQLMIIYFVILMPLGVEKMIAAYVCFGINSGAYVAEIIRGGIMAVDAGQMEAGRSLGFNYVKTMWYIIIPQTIKAVLPALANEFIVLLKESSVASYIGIVDLTQGGNIIRGVTYSAFMPLIAVALIYLALVMGLSKLVSLLERRLNKSDRG